MHDPTAPYRKWLRDHGYQTQSQRRREVTRIKGKEGQRQGVYTVTLTHPDGRVTQHTAPDSMVLAYRAACAANPCGLPPLADKPPPPPAPPKLL